ncbi:MAG: transglutaminase domain-containing protein [Deltaproteobacteria bacterium]|nr:transglutaminase domain-containing protein [Candidatus Zymogenaceae bacterium]
MTDEKNSMEQYINPTDIIDSDHPTIVELAQSLTAAASTDAERASRLFYHARDAVRYNPYSPFHHPDFYRASTVLKRGYGYCIQKAVVLAALGRAVNIPTRLGFADIQNHQLPKKLLELQGTDIIFSHGFTEFFIEGRWRKATPAFNIEMCDLLGLIPVEFDGVHDGVFPKYDRSGNLSIVYLKDVGHWPDLPFDHIIDAFFRLFGEDRMNLLLALIEEHGFDGAMTLLGAGKE